ncbi:NeuD/PglB/VioB family sugar acetyltransferase [Pedococcus sp.]|uniref:NeuD/PglB/VioB family sugar acetyltransferase n=1 Tax=Pedococcus sp. TaxID=2860345 RepID=UPI002E14ABC5|nr:NeuD/PglB/VioB family sugar acetyltransferase [Pedococcus sp.]
MGNGLVLVAAGGLALETAEAATAAGLEVAGCVDDDSTRWGTAAGGWLPVLGGVEEVVLRGDAPLVLCAGRGAVREQLAARLEVAGVDPGRYARVVHPSVAVPGSCSVGAGTVLLAGVVLTAAVTVGSHVVAMPKVTLTHDDVVGDFATLCAGVTLGGGVRVGRAAYLGMSCSVRERVTVGAGSILGMGAVVTRDVPPGETWVGVPARRLVSD